MKYAEIDNYEKYMEKIDNWSKYLKGKADNKLLDEIKRNTLKGMPSGDNKFILKLENILGIKIHSNKVGRPKKKK